MAEPCPPHVLFVDDDPATLDVAQRALERFGFRVTTRDAPDLDPDAVVRLAPDMVALDYWYGRQPLAVPFLERLRSHPTTAHLPVLLVSAATLAVARDRTVIDPLVDAVLAKPYGIFELRDAVEGCLRAGGRAEPADRGLPS